jgi:predicted phage terminase large subunit-like protein
LSTISAQNGDAAILRAQRSLWHFAHWIYPPPLMQWDWHHRVICDYCDRLLAGEIRRLMIFAPPRHSKSTLVSHLLPALAFGQHPDWELLSCSHTAKLAKKFNKIVQKTIDHQRYKMLFPSVGLPDGRRRDGKAQVCNAEEFAIVGTGVNGEPHRGYYNCAGVGGAIVGSGFELGIIDDPIKSAEVMSSGTQLGAIYDWYESDFYSRRNADNRILLMHQRRGIDDLAGYLVEQCREGFGDGWTILNLPAAAYDGTQPADAPEMAPEDMRKPGEYLWPARFSDEYYEQSKRNVEDWETQAQQHPRGSASVMFPKDSWAIVDAIPRTEIVGSVRFWDLSGTERGDPWGNCLMHKTRSGLYYIEYGGCFNAGPVDGEEKMIAAAKADGRRVAVRIEEEKGAAGKLLSSYYVRLLAGFDVAGVPVSGAKAVRAKPYSAQVQAGNVRLLRGPWNTRFRNQHHKFTGAKGKKDDIVDAASGAFSELADIRIITPRAGPTFRSIDYGSSEL